MGVHDLVERFFVRLSAQDWAAFRHVLAAEVERIGPFGDRVTGRENYVEFLAASVPAEYGNEVHLITYAGDGRSAFARVTEHLKYPDRELHLEETYLFGFDEVGRVAHVEVFWQTPQFDHGGFGSATEE